MRKRDDGTPETLARQAVRLAVEHVVPAIVYQCGEALRERAKRKHDAAQPKPDAPK